MSLRNEIRSGSKIHQDVKDALGCCFEAYNEECIKEWVSVKTHRRILIKIFDDLEEWIKGVQLSEVDWEEYKDSYLSELEEKRK